MPPTPRAGASKPNATTLLPKYLSTTQVDPDDTNICYLGGSNCLSGAGSDLDDTNCAVSLRRLQGGGGGGGDATPPPQKCEGDTDGSCRQLKIRPSATYVESKR